MKKELFVKISKCVVSFAILLTSVAVNSTCPFVTYQPKLPESAKKLKRYE